jgi:DNA helicase-2/ATP-dependent DNA helicase PcrA
MLRPAVPLGASDIAAAEARQSTAAHDGAPAVRLVAGPGTGKSATIEERVRWLLDSGVGPQNIYAVSFTRASAADLRARIRAYCVRLGVVGGDAVSVTTLHSLALRVLRRAGLLVAYPAGPMVLDDWELRYVFEQEYATDVGTAPTRSGEIRLEHEAFWSTGNWTPANFIPPAPPITSAERASFNGFHRPRTQTYACVLPGEIVRAAVDHIVAGTLDARDLLDAEHLVVDEYQDLNPADIEFIDHLLRQGASGFVAGDDDQSIYSFRFADPTGIQTFLTSHAGSTGHELHECFRCTPTILTAGIEVIQRNPLPGRIAKSLRSMYTTATPPLDGHMEVWRFANHRREAEAIAESCTRLIAAGVAPEEILILLSNRNALAQSITTALDDADVPHEAAAVEALKDADEGRAILSLLRVICDPDDYVALRVLLGLLSGVGLTTTNRIANTVVSNNLNYKDLYFLPLPSGVFSGRETSALDRVRQVTLNMAGWSGAETLAQRGADVRSALDLLYGGDTTNAWDTLVGVLPQDATLEEVRNVVWSDSDSQAAAVREAIYTRLALPVPEEAAIPARVRLMTMHRAKGLSAQVVLIPGMEEEVFPGERRARYAGLVLEAARLLYVSMTRARACCVVTYARRRTVFGRYITHAPSRFIPDLGSTVSDRAIGLTASEAAGIADTIRQL